MIVHVQLSTSANTTQHHLDRQLQVDVVMDGISTSAEQGGGRGGV